MAQGDVFIDGDGKIGIDATGKIRLVDASSDCPDCCGCTASGTSCGNCDDVTPSQYEVTFSSITACSCFNAGGRYHNYTLSTAINGTHTLTQVGGSSCKWQKIITNGIANTSYGSPGSADPTCTTVDRVDTQNINIDLNRNPSGWVLEVYSDPILYVTGSAATVTFYLFSDTSISSDTSGADELCATISATATSALASCGSSFGGGFEAATGGTGTLVCL